MTPRHFLAGVWLALEDITYDNGPLFYYPGSHKLPDFSGYDMGMTFENCVYYTPLTSNMVSGEYFVRDIENIATGKMVPNQYNHHPTRIVRQPNGLARVEIAGR